MKVKSSRKGSPSWQVWNPVGNSKSGNSKTLAWQLLVTRVHLVLVVGVHGDGHEHVLLHRVGQHPKVHALVPPHKWKELPVIGTGLIQLIGKRTKLHNSHWKVLTRIRPCRPGGSPPGEHFVEKARVFCRLPPRICLALVPQRPLYCYLCERVDHGVVDECVGVELVVVIDVLLHPADVQGRFWGPPFNSCSSGCRSDQTERSVAKEVGNLLGKEEADGREVRHGTHFVSA